MNEVQISYETLWNMPVWEREYFVKLINDRNSKINSAGGNENDQRYEKYMEGISKAHNNLKKPPNIK